MHFFLKLVKTECLKNGFYNVLQMQAYYLVTAYIQYLSKVCYKYHYEVFKHGSLLLSCIQSDHRLNHRMLSVSVLLSMTYCPQVCHPLRAVWELLQVPIECARCCAWASCTHTIYECVSACIQVLEIERESEDWQLPLLSNSSHKLLHKFRLSSALTRASVCAFCALTDLPHATSHSTPHLTPVQRFTSANHTDMLWSEQCRTI